MISLLIKLNKEIIYKISNKIEFNLNMSGIFDFFCCIKDRKNNNSNETNENNIEIEMNPESYSFRKSVLNSSKLIHKKSLLNEEEDYGKVEIKKKSKSKCKSWSNEEEKLLKRYFKEFDGKWSLISKKIPNKSASQCSYHYSKIKKKRKIWTVEEDQIVLNLVVKHETNWQLISKVLKNRTGKQIRDRYINILDPSINHSPWTEEEDNILIKYYYKIGPKWSEISKFLNGRPENMIKNRFYSSLKKKINENELSCANTNEINEISEENDEEILDMSEETKQVQESDQIYQENFNFNNIQKIRNSNEYIQRKSIILEPFKNGIFNNSENHSLYPNEFHLKYKNENELFINNNINYCQNSGNNSFSYDSDLEKNQDVKKISEFEKITSNYSQEHFKNCENFFNSDKNNGNDCKIDLES